MKKYRNIETSKYSLGFTAIETIATIFVFSIVVLVFGRAFVDSLNLQRRAYAIQQAEENISFVLEAMAKEIRVSQITDPAGDTSCPASPSNTLTMDHPVNGTISYTLMGNNVQRTVAGTDTIFNSAAVQFARLQFCITGIGSLDQKQPRVTVIAKVRSADPNQQVFMDVQTTISARYLSN